MPTIIMLLLWAMTGNVVFAWLALGCFFVNRLVLLIRGDDAW